MHVESNIETVLQEAIAKVLREESRNRHKFNVTRAYCNQKLTDLRCEERRRVSNLCPTYWVTIYISCVHAIDPWIAAMCQV